MSLHYKTAQSTHKIHCSTTSEWSNFGDKTKANEEF